jgi:two-component system, CAI-1 autoinducer sensor kinase/phosphatase CqsS
MNYLSRFSERIRQNAIDIVDYSEPNTQFIGLVGLIGYPFLYIVFQYVFPQHYNNFVLYFIGILFNLPQVFYRFIPTKLKHYYTVHFFMGGFYALPFFSIFMLLKNECTMVWVLVTLGSLLFLIIIFYDWLIITMMTGTAFVLAHILVFLLDGKVKYTYMEWSDIPVIVICYVGAIALNHRKQMSQVAKLSLMKGLSGMIAHEMRNPLNTITFAMETVQATLPAKPAGIGNKAEKFMLSYDELTRIHNVIGDSINTVRSGNKMIDSILSNLREGEIDKRSFRRHSILNVILSALNTYSYKRIDERKMIFIDNMEDFDFFGDKEQFIYVLFNLINNALYYSQESGFRIDISTETTPDSNVVRIRNTGAGVPAALREKIFNRFYSAGKPDGNGLGLSFCRRVIESFSGSITCDSVENSWTEFIITLPTYESRCVESIKKQILASKLILVVDDQFIIRRAHVKYLAEMDCRVEQAENGRQAIEMAAQIRYDMILMDIEMPVLNGDDAVRLLRSGFSMTASMKLHYRDAAIIGVTALPEDEAVRRTLNVGMNEFVLKPVNKDVLARLIEKYFFNELDANEAETHESLAGARILLADDNVTTRKFVSIVLENEGSDVTQAENGRQVLGLLEQADFDLVLMDMEMPVVDGIAAAKSIRNGDCFKRFRQFRSIPIIAVTGNSNPETIKMVTDAGMNAYIGKPVSKQDLIRTISFWIGHSRNNEPDTEAGNAMSGAYDEPKAGSISDNGDMMAPLLERSTIDSLQNIGGYSLMKTFFDLFQQDVAKYIGDLEIAISDDNLDLANQTSHALKGVASNMGAGRMHLLSADINDTLREGRWPEQHDWLDQLRLIQDETSKAFEQYLTQQHEIPGSQ